MTESLEDRLRDHATAFDSLLQLIPAKIYYGEDTSNQWQRKKQTKEQARAAKLAKLDPDNAKTAKDILDERARKRKREDEDGSSEIEGPEKEKPREGLKDVSREVKRPRRFGKTSEDRPNPNLQDQPQPMDAAEAKARKRKDKRERKKAKQDAKAAKIQAKKARKEQEAALVDDSHAGLVMAERFDSDEEHCVLGSEVDHIDVAGMVDDDDVLPVSESTATPSPTPQSPPFDISNGLSGASSISSIAPSTLPLPKEPVMQLVKNISAAKTSQDEIRARLQERIELLRAARKAEPLDSTPARNRQELMDARRRKEEQRKAHKKGLRQKAREEELRQRDLALARGSPLFSPALTSSASGSNALPSPLREASDTAPHSLSFGRIVFSNGQSMTASLGSVVEPLKTRGPQDPLTALQAAKRHADHTSTLDPDRKAEIEEKETWLNARKRAHGERIRDDSSLLKKTLKRKEKAKRKSEKEWGERVEGVEKGKAMKQKKREENLQKRRDEKGSKGKSGKVKGPKKGKGKPKVKARPGFEGSFRAKVGVSAR